MKTSDLTGPALDWAVAKCEGVEFTYEEHPAHELIVFQYSTDWAQGGPIIQREKIDVMWCGDRWCAYAMTPDGESQLMDEGHTPLIAAMRCFVASKLGDEVEIPKELKVA